MASTFVDGRGSANRAHAKFCRFGRSTLTRLGQGDPVSDALENIRKRERLSVAPDAPKGKLRRSESYAHPHLRTQHATTNDLQSPNIVAASIEVEHRALVRGARAVGLRLTSIRPACVRQGKHHRRPPLPEMCARRQGPRRSAFCNTAAQI
jgi:hypothetical protein